MAKSIIILVGTYKDTSTMIKAAIKVGFKHLGGNGFLCKNCGDKKSTRKFTKGRGILYGCNSCGARWGSLVKEKATPVVDDEAPADEYSELKVMHSNAGYYIGREDEVGAPYSRESGYYRAFDEANTALIEEFEVRDCAENAHAYASGVLPDIRK